LARLAEEFLKWQACQFPNGGGPDNFIQQQKDYLDASTDYVNHVTGDPSWTNISPTDYPEVQDFLDAAATSVSESSPSGTTISTAERSRLLAMPLPAALRSRAAALLNRFQQIANGTIGTAFYRTLLDRANVLKARLVDLQDAGWTTTTDGLGEAFNSWSSDALALVALSDASRSYRISGGGIGAGTLASSASFNKFVVAPNSPVTIEYAAIAALDSSSTDSGRYVFGIAQANVTSGGRGSCVSIPQVDIELIKDEADDDGDGLPNAFERVLGTNMSLADTDGDGINDLDALIQGLNPTGGQTVPTGIMAALSLRGTTKAVAAAASVTNTRQTLAYAATGDYGLAVVDVSQFDRPVTLGQLRLAGDSQDIAVDSLTGIAVVASGPGGLHFVDVSDAMQPRRMTTFSVNARQVEIIDGLAYVATDSNIQIFDVLNGDRLSTFVAGTANIVGMAREQNILYTMDEGRTVRAIEVDGASLELRGEIVVPQGRGQLSALNGIVYAGAQPSYLLGGFVTIDFQNIDAPTLISGSDLVDPFIAPGIAIVPNGSGLALVPGRVGRAANVPVVGVADATNLTVTDAFINQFNLPSVPYGAIIASGIGYVANGEAGLVVVNYVPFDTQGRAPTISITSTAVDNDSATPGVQVDEGSVFSIRSTITDDVQVRNVELLVNGAVVANAVSAPFDLSAVVPPLATGTSITVQARAYDTGGNRTLSETLEYVVTPDRTPPRLSTSSPRQGGASFQLQTLSFRFNEPLDTGRLSTDGITITNLGPDNRAGTADDMVFTVEQVGVISDRRFSASVAEALPSGRYQVSIAATIIADRAGNQLADTLEIEFINYDASEGTIAWISDGNGDWSNPANWSDDRVPGPDDNVIIDRLDQNPEITISSGDIRVNSIRSNERLRITGGSLTVADTSVLSERLIVQRGSITASGPNASFVATEQAILEGGSLFATGGGQISLPGAVSYVQNQGNTTATLRASGAGSVLDLSNVVSLGLGGQVTTLVIDATNGGRVDLSSVTQISDPATSNTRRTVVSADGVGSIIDFAAMVNFLDNSTWDANWDSSITASNRGTVSAPNLVGLRNVTLTEESNGRIIRPAAAVAAAVDAALDLWDAPSESELDLTDDDLLRSFDKIRSDPISFTMPVGT
jgi:hypothetical protein